MSLIILHCTVGSHNKAVSQPHAHSANLETLLESSAFSPFPFSILWCRAKEKKIVSYLCDFFFKYLSLNADIDSAFNTLCFFIIKSLIHFSLKFFTF